MSYALELAGDNATWFFDQGHVRIVYKTGMLANTLLKKLGERTVPDTALAGVVLVQDTRNPVLSLRLRPGACPLLEAARGQLPDRGDPYRLVVPAAKRDLAEHYAAHLRDRVGLNPDADRAAPDFLLSAPPPPSRVKSWQGEASFDGAVLTFSPDRETARKAKVTAGPQHVPVGDILGVEWATPAGGSGHFRVRTTGSPSFTLEPDVDPHAIVFGFGPGTTADSLSFTATVLAALPPRTGEPAAGGSLAATTDEVVAAIRKLGELRELGLLTEEEFSAKKAELLSRL
ncbi:hypothetical protein JOF53_006226 [Crossiella equi]|uniref:SHOCT domain-containing protein n=1 Tax=Crossiella equi TaxID=130796 RepID=A0ABS5AMC2_9PSEU|nr:DUF4429 domain-containing protein [Crossiella equi]MBP2477354.1 hypothetical protein [Crossiella equi]